MALFAPPFRNVSTSHPRLDVTSTGTPGHSPRKDVARAAASSLAGEAERETRDAPRGTNRDTALTMKNGGLTMKNGGLTMKNGGLTMKNGGFNMFNQQKWWF